MVWALEKFLIEIGLAYIALQLLALFPLMLTWIMDMRLDTAAVFRLRMVVTLINMEEQEDRS